LVEIAPSLDAHLLMPMIGAPIEPSRVEGVETWWRTISVLEQRENRGRPEKDHAQLMPIGDPID
jgi:hypothetical protein